jgi:hypothetical protein
LFLDQGDGDEDTLVMSAHRCSQCKIAFASEEEFLRHKKSKHSQEKLDKKKQIKNISSEKHNLKRKNMSSSENTDSIKIPNIDKRLNPPTSFLMLKSPEKILSKTVDQISAAKVKTRMMSKENLPPRSSKSPGDNPKLLHFH